MTVLINAEINEKTVTARTHSRIMRDVNRKAMTNHRDKRLGKHYRNVPETAPGGAYNYTKRSEKYTKRKLQKKGHDLPNVYSGKMKRYIRNNSTVTATQHRARFRARNYFPMNAQRKIEIEAVSQQEQLEIAEEIRTNYYAEAAKPENQRQRKRKTRA